MVTQEVVSQLVPEAGETSVVAMIRSDVDTFLVDLFNKLDYVVTDKNILRKADVALHLHQIVESAVRRRRNDHVRFYQLPIDVIHCVFAELLDLDRIYDATFPILAIEGHRKHLFTLRRVSTAWNDLLVSSPRYWPAVNIGSDQQLMKLTIKRARNTPLIIYSGVGSEFDGYRAYRARQTLESENCALASKIAAIRVDGSGGVYLFSGLLKKGMTLLTTLEVPLEQWPGGVGGLRRATRPRLSFELPQLRNLLAKRWEPPADAQWLTGLQTLRIKEIQGFGANTLGVLNACVNLRELELQSQSWGLRLPEENYDNTPIKITLPRLRQLTMELEPNRPFLGQLVRRLVIPQETPGQLRFHYFPPHQSEDRDNFFKDLGQFIFPLAGVRGVVDEAVVEIHSGIASGRHVWLTYKAGSRSIGFPRTYRAEDKDLIADAITNLQGLLNNPPLTLVVIDHIDSDTILRRLADLGVEKIRIKGPKTNVEKALASIGSRRPNLPTGTITDTDWPFESVKELFVEDITLGIGQLLRIVGMRQPYLRSTSKTWLERILLVNCQFTGMSVGQAVNKFAKLGVVLVGSGCERAPRPKKGEKK